MTVYVHVCMHAYTFVCVHALCDRLQSKYKGPFPRWSRMNNLAANDIDKLTFIVCVCVCVFRKPVHLYCSHFE